MVRRRLALLASVASLVLGAALLAAPAPKPDDKRLPREVREAREALGLLRRRAADAKAKPEELWKEYMAFRLRFSGTTECVQAAEVMNKVPSPLDKLDRNAIPPEDRPPWLPKEVVAVLGEHRGRHWEEVRHVAVSPDGKLVASMGEVVRVWNARTMYEYAALEPTPAARPWGMAFIPKQRQLVVAYRGRLVVWDLTGAKPKVETTITGMKGNLSGLVVSPNGKAVACASLAGIEIWDLGPKGPRRRALLECDRYGGGTLAFSPSRKFFADDGGKGREGRLWRLGAAGAKEPVALPGTQKPLVFSPDGKTLVTGVQRATHIRLWDVTGAVPKVKATLGGRPVHIDQVAFSPNGQLLATASHEHKLRLWPLYKGQRKKLGLDKEAQFAEYAIPTRIQSLAWFPDGKTLALGGKDGVVRLWDVAKGAERFPVRGHNGPVRAVAFAPDCRTLASGGDDTTVRLWDVARVRPIERAVLRAHCRGLQGLAFAPQGRYLISATVIEREFGKNVRLWDLATSPPTACASLQSHTAGLIDLTFSARGSFILAGGRDEPAKGESAERDPVTSVGVMRIWEFKDGRFLPREVIRPKYLPEEKDRYLGYANLGAVSPTERMMALGFGRSWRLWDLSGKKSSEIAVIGHNPGLYSALAFSPDGKLLVCPAQVTAKVVQATRYCLTIWETGRSPLKKRASLALHQEMPATVAFLPDGRGVVALTENSHLILWKGNLLEKVADLSLPKRSIKMALAADGRHVALASTNGTVYILRLRHLLEKP